MKNCIAIDKINCFYSRIYDIESESSLISYFSSNFIFWFCDLCSQKSKHS